MLGLLFVHRFSLQSLGDTVVPMLSGALELILRISVVLVLSKVFNLGFSICIAEVSAWFGAAALLRDIFTFVFTNCRKNFRRNHEGFMAKTERIQKI